jgi:hypothetical protein
MRPLQKTRHRTRFIIGKGCLILSAAIPRLLKIGVRVTQINRFTRRVATAAYTGSVIPPTSVVQKD